MCRRNILTFGFLFVLSLCLIAVGNAVLAAQQDPEPPPLALDALKPAVADWSVDITSPLGRTGVVTKVRIVAQMLGAPADRPIRAFFYVDGKLLGEVAAPPYALEWVDDNPFEAREIVVQAQDADGRAASDGL